MKDDLILNFIDPSEPGLEVGGGPYPFATHKRGFKYVDRINVASEESVIDHAKKISESEDVSFARKIDLHLESHNCHGESFIWKGESYKELVGKERCYKWIIANHVIEHTPDLISFLLNCSDVLTDDGVIFLTIPDKRFLFDRFRALTGIGEIIDSFLESRTNNTVGSVIEQYMYSATCNQEEVWSPLTYLSGENKLELWNQVSSEQLRQEFKNRIAYSQDNYMDCHRWCFTPTSFRLIIEDLADLGLISLKEQGFHGTLGCEFYMCLSFTGNGMQKTRLDALKEIEFEISHLESSEENKSILGLIQRIKNEKLEKISIYGYGVIGKSIFKFLKDNTNIDVEFVFDMNPQEKNIIDSDMKIKPPIEMGILSSGHGIVISSRAFKNDMVSFVDSNFKDKNFKIFCI